MLCYYTSIHAPGHDSVVSKKSQDLVMDKLLQEEDIQRDSLDTTAVYTYI